MGLLSTLLISLLVFVPMTVVLWTTLYEYSYPYTEYTYYDSRKIAFALAGGMAIGTILFLCFLYYPLYNIYNAIIFAVIEELVKLVILNFPKLRLKFDTTFYGVAIGLGIACMLIAGISYRTERNPNVDLFDPGIIIMLVVYSFTLALILGTTSGLVGFACAKGLIWRYVSYAIALHILFNLVMIPFLHPKPQEMGIFYYVAIGMGFTISLISYLYLYMKVIPETFPPDIKRQHRREVRERKIKLKLKLKKKKKSKHL